MIKLHPTAIQEGLYRKIRRTFIYWWLITASREIKMKFISNKCRVKEGYKEDYKKIIKISIY